MVQIPTTERKFYDTTPKVNTLALYADALKPAVQNANKIFMDQQRIKIATKSTQARIDADDYVKQMRLQYQGNPDSPEFKQAIQSGLNDIFERYGEDIDPMAKGEWNLTANKMTGAYELSNNDWIIKQRAQNVKLDIADNINANLKLARRAGNGGNWQAGVEDFKNSYGQLFDYAQKNLGETDTRKLLKDYEQQYMTNFINGMAENDPSAALKALEQPEIADMIGDEKAQKTIKQLVRKQNKIQNYNNKLRQYQNEMKLSEQLDSLPINDAIQLLSVNEDKVGSKYYRAKMRALKSQKTVDAVTNPNTATDILRNISSLTQEDTPEYLDSVQDALASVEEAYADGKIAALDKQLIIKQLTNKPLSIAEAVKTADNKTPVMASFNFNDAYKYVQDNYGGNDKDEILMDYVREINTDDSLSNVQKQEVLQTMLVKATQKTADRTNLRVANATYYPNEEERGFMKEYGYSYEDVVYTAQQRGLSVSEVLRELGKQQHKTPWSDDNA